MKGSAVTFYKHSKFKLPGELVINVSENYSVQPAAKSDVNAG